MTQTILLGDCPDCHEGECTMNCSSSVRCTNRQWIAASMAFGIFPKKASAKHVAAFLEQARTSVPDDVRRLVIAARVVAFERQDADALRELDQASEAFASRVPWERPE